MCTLEKVYTGWESLNGLYQISHIEEISLLSYLGDIWGKGGQPRRPWIDISIYIGNTSIYLYFYLVDSICCRHSQNILKFIVYRWVKKATRDREHGPSLALSNPKMSHSFVGTSTGLTWRKIIILFNNILIKIYPKCYFANITNVVFILRTPFAYRKKNTYTYFTNSLFLFYCFLITDGKEGMDLAKMFATLHVEAVDR